MTASKLRPKAFDRMSTGDIVFECLILVLLILLCLSILLPFLYLLALSFDKKISSFDNTLLFWPKEFTLENYKLVFSYPGIWTGYANTVFITAVGTAGAVFFTSMAAYALSKKRFPHRNFWTFYVIFTMYFSGGLIPTYLWINNIGLMNTRLVLFLPSLVTAYNMVIVRNFFQQVPPEMEEAAYIDGASDFQTFFRIILPTSVPILATVALWVAVGLWNAWFPCMIYIKDENKIVVQVILQRIISNGTDPLTAQTQMLTSDFVPKPETLKAACIYVVTLPILCVYPFVQKYFVKGIYIGSLKG